MKRPVALVLALLLATSLPLASCTASADAAGKAQVDRDTLTRRQKDSIISTLPLPGAGAVGKALRASDLARQRALAHDTIH